MRKAVLSLIVLACLCAPAFADPESVIVTAVEAASKHDYDTAIRILTGVIEDPATPPGYIAGACYYRGVAYFRKGDNKAALRDLDRAIQITPPCRARIPGAGRSPCGAGPERGRARRFLQRHRARPQQGGRLLRPRP